MNNIFIVLCFVIALQMNLVANIDVPFQKKEQTFIQEYSKYSITLPERWKLIGDENDVVPIPKASGLYRYVPGPKKDITIAEWAALGNPPIQLQICMLVCPAGIGIGKAMQNLKFDIAEKLIVEEKGTCLIQDKKAQWWIGKSAEGANSYLFFVGNNEKLYIVEFIARNLTSEAKLQCDEIIKTFTFLN